MCDGFASDFVCDVENPCEHEEKKKVKIHANMRKNVQFNKICMLRVNPCQHIEKMDTHTIAFVWQREGDKLRALPSESAGAQYRWRTRGR
jgi:hypothetical protein